MGVFKLLISNALFYGTQITPILLIIADIFNLCPPAISVSSTF